MWCEPSDLKCYQKKQCDTGYHYFAIPCQSRYTKWKSYHMWHTVIGWGQHCLWKYGVNHLILHVIRITCAKRDCHLAYHDWPEIAKQCYPRSTQVFLHMSLLMRGLSTAEFRQWSPPRHKIWIKLELDIFFNLLWTKFDRLCRR